jgi:DNA repair protein RadC
MLIKDVKLPYKVDRRKRFTDHTQLEDFFLKGLEMNKMDQEQMVLVCLDNKLKMIGYFIIAKGTERICPISPTIIFKKALAVGAMAIAIAHNHPSGEPKPSEEDIKVTNKIRDGAELLGIYFIDHFIIGSDGIYSI